MSEPDPESAAFIYAHKETGCAWPQTARADDVSPVVLLFTCPVKWLPKTREEFNKACQYYGIQQPKLYSYSGDLIPF